MYMYMITSGTRKHKTPDVFEKLTEQHAYDNMFVTELLWAGSEKMADFDNDRGDFPEEAGGSPDRENDTARPELPEGAESPVPGDPPAEEGGSGIDPVLTETVTESLFASEESPDPEKADEVSDAEAEKAANGINGVMIGMSLCDAVAQAVGRERFHGGVRPENISVRDGQVFLGSTLKHGVGEFTPQELEYMAPELFWDGIRSPSADVYSVGLVLYSLFNYGRLPFWPSAGAITPNARASALQKRMSDEAVTPPASADAELAAIILRALAFRTEDR